MSLLMPQVMRKHDPRQGVVFEQSQDGGGNVGNHAAETEWAKKISDVLMKHYPGYLWAVHVHIDAKTRGAHIKLPVLMQTAKTYAIPLHMIQNANDLDRVIMQAGGQILERFGISRSHFDLAGFLFARQTKRLLLPGDKMPT